MRMSSKGPRYVVLRNQNKRSAVEYWARVLLPWKNLLIEEDLQATTPQIERWLEEKSNMEPWCALRLLPFPSEVAV